MAFVTMALIYVYSILGYDIYILIYWIKISNKITFFGQFIVPHFDNMSIDWATELVSILHPKFADLLHYLTKQTSIT